MFKPSIRGTNFTLGVTGFVEQERQISIAVDEFDLLDPTPYKVFVQLEPPEIVPNVVQRLIEQYTFYNLIIAWQENVLDNCPNAVKYIYGNCSWALNPVDACDVSQKKFEVSYLTSAKTMCKGHYFRHEVFNKLPSKIGQVSITKHMSPPVLECKRPLLYPYQYSIIIENAKHVNWCTEKLIDCLLSRAIPIYYGAPNVGEYFDASGILTFSSNEELQSVLKGLTPEFYQSRLAAIEHNFHEAMKYVDVHKRLNNEIRRRLSDNTWNISPQRPSEAVRKRLHR